MNTKKSNIYWVQLLLSFIVMVPSITLAQKYPEGNNEGDHSYYSTEVNPDLINKWDDIDFMYITWEDIQHKFVPEQIKETTLLFETFTLDQYIDSMEVQLSLYFYNKGIDTSIQLSSMNLSGYMDEQLKETRSFRKKYGSRMHATNAEFIDSYTNIDEYRFVLKRHFIIENIDPHSGNITAGEEFYFYDRKKQKAYPIIKADYVWISLNI